jgi:hypothetical protein
MRHSARGLLKFSFVCLLGVLVSGTMRGVGPVRAWLDHAPDAARTAALFHSHFDQLCWLGAAAVGAALWILRDTYRGPAWAPLVFAFTYSGGALLFSSSFALKLVGQRLGSAALQRVGFAVLLSTGGALLVAAFASGLLVAAGLLRGQPEREIAASQDVAHFGLGSSGDPQRG